MSPIVRYPPGSKAPVADTYALVGHYGESTGFAIWRDQDETLPLVAVAADLGPLWYVPVAKAMTDAQAA